MLPALYHSVARCRLFKEEGTGAWVYFASRRWREFPYIGFPEEVSQGLRSLWRDCSESPPDRTLLSKRFLDTRKFSLSGPTCFQQESFQSKRGVSSLW